MKKKQPTGKNKNLEALKKGLIALHAGNFDIEADNPKIVKCWEHFQCPKTNCPAYGKLRCWSIAGTLCRDSTCTERATRLGDCKKCVVYQKSCSDEISELLELFNQTVKDLKYSARHTPVESTHSDQEQGQRLEEMAAIVAHETRNPLHVIALAIGYLKRNITEDIFATFLQSIEEEIQRLNQMTESFLRFSAPIKLEIHSCDLARAAQDAVTLLLPLAREKGISLDVTPALHQATIACDCDQIQEAISALVKNALQACTTGDTVLVATEATSDLCVVIVSDSGSGMDLDTLQKSTTPFFTTKTRGVGLGLTMAEKMAAMHGGKLTIDSMAQRGTTVKIILPTHGLHQQRLSPQIAKQNPHDHCDKAHDP